MKNFTLGLFATLLGCMPALGAVPPVLSTPLVGTYQALLHSETDVTGRPAGLLVITTLPTGKFSGKLTTDENKTYSFSSKKTAFSYTADTDEMDDLLGTCTTPVVEIARGKLPKLTLGLIIEDKTGGPVLKVTLGEDVLPTRLSNSGFKVKTYARNESAETAGTYTGVFELADDPGEDEPAGSGYAAITVDKKGVMKLTGKTGDGTAFTFSAANGPGNQFLVYTNPYKRAGSFFGGVIQLTDRAGGGYQMKPAETGYDFQWAKSSILPKTSDKSYRKAFGPLDVLVSIEPWKKVPTTPPGQTLSSMLGLGSDKVFNLALEGKLDKVAFANRLAVQLGLNANNSFRVAAGGTGSPSVLLPAAWTKFFTLKVDPKTGKITGSLKLEKVDTTNPTRPRTITLKAVIEGVMLQLETGDNSPFAQGFVQVPPEDTKKDTIFCDRFAFTGPVVVDPYIAMTGITAGTYEVTCKKIFEVDKSQYHGFDIDVTGTMKKVPEDGARLRFTISPDLTFMTFNGRKIPLKGDSRPIALVFSDISSSNVRDTLTVEVFLKDSGLPNSIYAQYTQLLSAKINVPGYGRRSGFVPGVAGFNPVNGSAGDISKLP